MNLSERLKELAKACDPWDDRQYILAIADLREILGLAAKRLDELEKQLSSKQRN